MTINWVPRIGDPSFLGWFTVFAYFAAAALCASTARRVRLRIRRDKRGFQQPAWWLMTLFLVALGINKQFDVQSLFTAIGRAVALRQGWYEERREVQFLFILAILVAAGAVSVVLLRSVRTKWREYGLMVVGFIFTVSFIVIRAASFHHFEVLRFPIGGIALHRAIELSAIALLAFAAVKRLRDIGRETRP